MHERHLPGDELCPTPKWQFTRSRYDYAPGFVNRMSYGPTLVEPISFVMERKMLLGIKHLAEREALS